MDEMQLLYRTDADMMRRQMHALSALDPRYLTGLDSVHIISASWCTYVLNAQNTCMLYYANASAFKWIRILTEKVRLRSTNRIHYSLWSATSSSGIFTGGSGCGAPSPSDGDTNMGNVDGIKKWEKVEQRSENREVKLFIPPRTMILLLNYRVIETSTESAY